MIDSGQRRTLLLEPRFQPLMPATLDPHHLDDDWPRQEQIGRPIHQCLSAGRELRINAISILQDVSELELRVVECGERRLATIIAVRDKLVDEGLEPIIVVDAALRHQIDDPDGYERLVEQGAIRQAPAGTDADYFILSFARELNACVLSNDRFRDRAKAFHDVCERVIRFMVVEGEVVLERRMKGRR